MPPGSASRLTTEGPLSRACHGAPLISNSYIRWRRDDQAPRNSVERRRFMSRAMRITCASILIASALCACSGAASRKASYLAHGRAYLASANYAKARIEFSNAAQIDPKDPEARFLLGQVAEKSGDARAALGNYQAAINIDPKKT